MPDMQLEQFVRVRRRRERKAAPFAVFQQEIDVLTREELQPFVRGKFDLDDRDIECGLVDRLDAARQAPDLDVAGAPHFAHFDH